MLQGDNYFKYFHQRGAIIWGRQLIKGWLLFEEIRHTVKHWTRYRIVHGKCGCTVFTHELLTYQKSNEWAPRTSEVSDTKTRSAHIPAQSTFHVVLCLLCTYWDIHHFGSLFFNLFKMLKFATTYCEMTNKMKLLSLHLILFSLLCFLLPCCLASSLQFSSLREYTQNYSLSISEVFLTFLQEKLFNKNFSFYMCAKHSQSKGTASCKCLRQELWYETHTPLWLLIARIIFLTHEKTLFTILIRRIIFFTCEKHCLLLWLVRTHLHMNIYDMPS